MTTNVEKSIEVDAPVRIVYDQWTQFEDFPQFMGGIQQVRQLDDRTLQWTAEIAGVKREWTATILDQVPDNKVAWAATEGATNAGAVYFTPMGADRTLVRLHLEYEPEGLVEKAGDALSIVERRAEADLEKFKAFLEARGAATGGWRGSVNEHTSVGTPGVEAALTSEGDSGKGGLSGKAMAAGAAAVVAGVAAAKALGGDSEESQPEVEVVDVEVVDVAPVAPVSTEPYPATTLPGEEVLGEAPPRTL